MKGDGANGKIAHNRGHCEWQSREWQGITVCSVGHILIILAWNLHRKLTGQKIGLSSHGSSPWDTDLCTAQTQILTIAAMCVIRWVGCSVIVPLLLLKNLQSLLLFCHQKTRFLNFFSKCIDLFSCDLTCRLLCLLQNHNTCSTSCTVQLELC